MTANLDHISAWQYDLPTNLIASRPTARRDDSRLMVVDRATGSIQDLSIRDLPSLLNPKDRLVFNNTKVVPARLFGFRTQTKGKWEGLFLSVLEDGDWLITGKTRGRLEPGETLTVYPAGDPESDQSLQLLLKSRKDGNWIVTPESDAEAFDLLSQFGTLPLPPYIGRSVADDEDAQRYQTVFAEQPGAIAAPTAGLHFTPELLKACLSAGIQQSRVTLHVGIGTFRPVQCDNLSEHQMHSEWCQVGPDAASEIVESKQTGGNVCAVGTTSVRTLEAAASENAKLTEWSGSTELFIRPGFNFRVVDHLLTNFHLPGSTLIVLVAALAGYDLTMEAYRRAVELQYRFYSYGDAMLVL